MTPYEIEILIHYHVSPTDWDGPSLGNPLWRNTMTTFVNSGLLTKTGKDKPVFAATKKLECYVEGLCALPLPEWRMPWKKRLNTK